MVLHDDTAAVESLIAEDQEFINKMIQYEMEGLVNGDWSGTEWPSSGRAHSCPAARCSVDGYRDAVMDGLEAARLIKKSILSSGAAHFTRRSRMVRRASQVGVGAYL